MFACALAHTAYPTTDVPLKELPRTMEWFRVKVRLACVPAFSVSVGMGVGGRQATDDARTVSADQSTDTTLTIHNPYSCRSRSTRCSPPTSRSACPTPPSYAWSTPSSSSACVHACVRLQLGRVLVGRLVDRRRDDTHTHVSTNHLTTQTKPTNTTRYDADGGQTSLKPHRDGSVLSFNIALNPSSEFDGGGTYFAGLQDALRIEQVGF